MPPIRSNRTRKEGPSGSSKRSVIKPAKRNTSSPGVDLGSDEIKELLPKGLARAYVQSQVHSAEKQLQAHGLQAPSEYEGDWPELPDDIDATDYSELSNLLLKFQNALSTAVWQQSFHYIWSGTFEEIAEYMESLAILATDQSNEGKRKADARTDDKVVFFRARYKEHYNSYVRFRDLARTLEGKIKAVSRVLGFKDDDEEANNLSAIKKRGSTRRSRNK